jgi:hypothetical protein
MCIALCLHGKPGVQWRCMVAWMAIPLHSHLSTLHMKRNHSTKRKTNHQHGIVSFATKSCIAHPRRAVVGHFDPSAEPRVPDRRQARTGARMWPAHKSRAGLRNQSRVVCTRDLTLPGRYVSWVRCFPATRTFRPPNHFASPSINVFFPHHHVLKMDARETAIQFAIADLDSGVEKSQRAACKKWRVPRSSL